MIREVGCIAAAIRLPLAALRANLHNMIRRLLLFFVAIAVISLPAGAGLQSGSQSAAPQSSNTGQTNSGAPAQPNTAAQPSPARGNRAQLTAALQMAERLLAAGKAAEAQATYQQVLKADPSSLRAQVGLIHSFIIQQKLDDARAAADVSLCVAWTNGRNRGKIWI